MTTSIGLFDGNFSNEHFETHSKENGFTHWFASDLMKDLEYKSWSAFQNAINKAMTTCNTLGIPIMENFIQVQNIIDGKTIHDFKLSRFACYLIVMNADGKNKSVAQAQVYFASLAGAINNYLEESNKVERLNIRGEISDREKSLAGSAMGAGLEKGKYGFFQNAGYRGMYNKNIGELKRMKNVPSNKSLLDFMGKDELAANLFRITQTELKIKQDNVKGQSRLEATAQIVGATVRKTMKEISGIYPEDLKTHEDIKSVKKELKGKSKKIKEIDKKKTPQK